MLFYMTLIEEEDDKSFFLRLYHTHRQEMFFSARDILGDDKDTEDAVQEAFLAAIPYLSRLPKDPAHPKTRNFLLTLADSKAIDIYRKRKRRTLFSRDDVLPHDHTDPITEGTAIARAIANLPFESRRLLLLRFDMGFTTREIARMLDKTEGAVTRAITRAKDKLRIELKKEGVEV